MPTDIAIWMLGGLFSVLFWLLKNKDENQSKQLDSHARYIEIIFKKIDDDMAALQNLRVHIASHHYEKSELDVKFEKLERTTSDGFRILGDKLDKLSSSMLTHIGGEKRGVR